MKKFLMAIMALAVATTVASAGIGISWLVAYGAYNSDATDLTGDGDALLENSGAIWQLIFAGADGIANRLDDISNPIPDQAAWAANNYLFPGSDDQLLLQRVIPQGGGSGNDAPYNSLWTVFLEYDGGDPVFVDLSWNTAGSVYQRIFQGLTPQHGTYFYESDLRTLDITYDGDPEGNNTSMPFSLGTSALGIQPTLQVQVIPEPATMSLLGLGALVMAIRRRRS